MYEIVADINRMNASDRAWIGLHRVCRSHRGTHGRDGAGALEHADDDRGRSDEVNQTREERLTPMNAIVPLGQLSIDVDELQAGDSQAPTFEGGQNRAGQAPLHGIRLDDNQRSFCGQAIILMAGSRLKVEGSELKVRSLKVWWEVG
jgi:hypothetical protein